MPIKFRWPFRWPWQKPASQADDKPTAAAEPLLTPAGQAETAARPASSVPSPEPVEPVLRALSGEHTPLSPPGAPDSGSETFELGAELLERLPQLSTPPTLGYQGGLHAMAQTLPTVERFLQNLPTPPGQRLLEGALAPTSEFAAHLPALASFGGAAPTTDAPAFPEQLAPAAPLTDVLPPLGSLPGQAPAISGQAPILVPTGPTREVVRIITERQPTDQRGPLESAGPPPPAAPSASPTAPPTPPHWPMTQVLPAERTVTGNILPAPEGPPVLRALAPNTPTGLGEFARPADGGERVSPEQRMAIERQRGQGAPLAPEVRQRFEQTYGQSLAEVRIHTGQAAHSTAESLNAIAFASGADLFFTQNSFRPDSPQGLSLIGHELAHVIQQQYGVPGDADALRPADDAFERQADRLAATALQAPLAEPAPSRAGPPIQRALVGSLPATSPDPLIPSPGLPAATLTRGQSASGADRPFSLGSVTEEPEPVQRFSLGSLGNLARQAVPQMPSLPDDLPDELPSLGNLADRAGGLTDQLPNLGGMLSNLSGLPSSLPDLGGLAPNMPSLSSLGGLLPSLPAGLPALGNLPSGLGNLANMVPGAQHALPAVQDALGRLGSLGGGLPSLGGLGQGIPGGLTDILPAVQSGLGSALPGGLPEMPQLPSLGGLQMPDMPLAEGLGGIGQALGGAAAAGQEALGSITSMAPSMPEAPGTPPLPSLEKLTEHVWKQVQNKLKVERERSRGLA